MSEQAAARAAREIAEFIERLGRGADAMARAVASAPPPMIGATPRDEVYREDKLVLYRYRPHVEVEPATRIETPVLICYALVNRPSMMDLQPDRSLIAGLLQRGLDVYLIDWGYPDGADRYLGMDDYVRGYLARCVMRVSTASGREQIHLLGVCQGGTFTLSYAALEPERVRTLITMATPVDFHTSGNLLARWARGVDVDAMVGALGNVPGGLLNALFLGLMPFRLAQQKYVHLFERLAQGCEGEALDNFLRMEQWIYDSPDQAGAMFREFLTWLVKENRLALGTLELGGRRVDLRAIRMPVLNIYASQDHIVPPASARALGVLIGTKDYTEHAFDGGHIGIYVSAAAQAVIPERIASWLRVR